jgi:hypothetical protein
MRGMDREHFLQLTAATPPIILQHLQSGWKGWQRLENVELKRQADRQLIGMVPKARRACSANLPPSSEARKSEQLKKPLHSHCAVVSD